jgi:hypothetical protein
VSIVLVVKQETLKFILRGQDRLNILGIYCREPSPTQEIDLDCGSFRIEVFSHGLKKPLVPGGLEALQNHVHALW